MPASVSKAPAVKTSTLPALMKNKGKVSKPSTSPAKPAAQKPAQQPAPQTQKPVATPGKSPNIGAQPARDASEKYREIVKLAEKIFRHNYNLGRIKEQLKRAFENDGKLTKEEFEKIFGIEYMEMTDGAWYAFRSGYDIKNIEHLRKCLQNFDDWSVANQGAIPFGYFAQLKKGDIYLIPPGVATDLLRGFLLRAIISRYTRMVSGILSHVTGKGYPNDNKAETYDKLNAAIASLDPKKRNRVLRAIAAGLIYKIADDCYKKYNLDLVKDLKGKMSDPLAVKRFFAGFVKDFVTGRIKDIRVKLGNFKRFVSLVKQLRKKVGNEFKVDGKIIKLDDLDPNTPGFNNILEKVNKLKSKKEILEALINWKREENRKKLQGKGAAPVKSKAKPVPAKAKPVPAQPKPEVKAQTAANQPLYQHSPAGSQVSYLVA